MPKSANTQSFKTVLTDGGRAASYRFDEDNDCAVRCIALTTGLSYDEAWDELTAAGRQPLEGFYWEEWARHTGFIQAPWTGQPEWYYRHVTLPPRKGFPRIKPRDLPSLFPVGRWVMTSSEHVESWINGRHYDSPTAVRLLNPSRIIFGAWECRKLAKDQRLYMAYRCYFLDGPWDSEQAGTRTCFKSALGPVPGTSKADAYRWAEKWYGWRIGESNSDLLVEAI